MNTTNPSTTNPSTDASVRYIVATVYKKDDILIATDGKHYCLHGDKRTYSDLGINPSYHWSSAQLKNQRPATSEDFDFFRVKPPTGHFDGAAL